MGLGLYRLVVWVGWVESVGCVQARGHAARRRGSQSDGWIPNRETPAPSPVHANKRTRSLEGLKAGAAALSDFLGVAPPAAVEEDSDEGVLAALALPLAVGAGVVVVVIGGGFKLLPLPLLLLPASSSLAGAVAAAVLSPPSVLMLPLPPVAIVCGCVHVWGCSWSDGAEDMRNTTPSSTRYRRKRTCFLGRWTAAGAAGAAAATPLQREGWRSSRLLTPRRAAWLQAAGPNDSGCYTRRASCSCSCCCSSSCRRCLSDGRVAAPVRRGRRRSYSCLLVLGSS